MRDKLLLDVPHRQIVFTIPKMLRVFFKSTVRFSLISVSAYRIYANAHRGKINKVGVSSSYPPIIEEEEKFIPSKGWGR